MSLKNGKRFCALLFTLILFSGFFLCAEESDSNQNSESVEKMKEDGKQLLFDIKNALEKAGDSFDERVRALTSRACVGKWEFKNGDSTTTIECLENGTMSFSQKKSSTSTFYRGTYTSSSTEILFYVSSWEEKSRFFRKSQDKQETWTISYKVSVDNPSEMRAYSVQFPKDSNGYDFSNPTIFVLSK